MIGANILPSGEIYFRVWAPKAHSISVVILEGNEVKSYPLEAKENGYFDLTLSCPSQTIDYYFCLNDEKQFPDPASQWQPSGVHGPSRVYDQRQFVWNDSHWKGIPLSDYLIYELHVGTFTNAGTFEGIIEKIPHLKNLGITAIELMPSVEFPGSRNWGYDGTFLYAPHQCYGGPNGLKTLISACHQAGIAVILDVVYNHLGPEGNYLDEFGYYFTDHYKVPWGRAINFDGPFSDPVRDYFIQNALYWITEFHIDALRFDAIHGIFDFSASHILDEISTAMHHQSNILGRQIFMTVESDLNDARILRSKQMGGYEIDAQWNDDFHHSLHTLITDNRWRYLSDFGKLEQLSHCIRNGFAYSGQWSQYRHRKHGNSSSDIPTNRFIVSIQNHDQIGNACAGKRLGSFIDLEAYLLASAILFFAPNIPMLFMGQEWNASAPFYYFTSFEDHQLAENITNSYIKESNHGSAKKFDPQNPLTFEHSKLDWDEKDRPEHLGAFRFYQALISFRHKHRWLQNVDKGDIDVMFDEEKKWLTICRRTHLTSTLLAVNFSLESQIVQLQLPEGVWLLIINSKIHSQENVDRRLESNSNRQSFIHLPSNCALIYESKLTSDL